MELFKRKRHEQRHDEPSSQTYADKIGGRTHLDYHGIKVPIGMEHIPEPVFNQIVGNRYEVPEINAIKALIHPGDRVLELGTGLGIVSGIASRLAEDIKVLSFEANPALMPHIAALHRLNAIENVDAENAILEPNPSQETRDFHLHRFFPEGSVIRSKHSGETISVPVRDLNAVIDEFRPTLMICDIEGAEAQLFEGADLGGLRALVLELHPKVIDRRAVKRIYDSCLAHSLYPKIENSSHQVVAFERV